MASVDRINGLTGDLAIKTPVRVATTANIALSGLQTIDGVLLVAGDRVLVKNQTDAVDNGIWVANTSSWSRALDWDGSYDVVQGTLVKVIAGTVNPGVFQLDTASPVIGTSEMTFSVSHDLTMVADLASTASGKGADLVGFLQAGTGAVSRTVQNKQRECLNLEDFGDVDTTGVVEATSVFNLATTAAAAQGKGVRLPAGIVLLDAVALPATLPALFGRGKYATTLKFKRQAYSAGQILFNASNNTAGVALEKFSIDCDSTEFKTAGIYAVVLNNSHNIAIGKVRVLGRGASAVFTNATTHGRINDLTVDATGAAGASFETCFQGGACVDVRVRGMRTTGLPTYSGVFGANTYYSCFDSCHSDGTSGGFGYSLGGCAFTHIRGCTVTNSSHEAYQITNSYYCSIDGNSAEWETGFGVDAGISINGEVGTPGLTRLNKVVNNTLINAYAAGLLCANNAQQNVFANNVLRDCAVRGTAAGGSGSAIAATAQYTDLAAVNCAGNTFRHNKITVETGAVTYAYAEFNNGAGSTLSSSLVEDNQIIDSGGITTRYLISSASTSRVHDLNWTTFAPTISPAGGAITSYAVNTAKLTLKGDEVRLTMDITITDAGSGTGALTILWGAGVQNAAANGGIIYGKEGGITGKLCGGIANAGGVVILHADASSVIATGARVVLSGFYRIA